MIASVDIAYVVRDTPADHPGLIAPARIIGMRAQGEAEIAIEQSETRYEGVTWTTPHQIAANQRREQPDGSRPRGRLPLRQLTATESAGAATRHDRRSYRRRTIPGLPAKWELRRRRGMRPVQAGIVGLGRAPTSQSKLVILGTNWARIWRDQLQQSLISGPKSAT